MTYSRALVCASLLALSVLAGKALAQAENGFEIDGGHKADYVDGRKSEGWYRIRYRGESLAERGTPFQKSDPAVPDAPKIDIGAAAESALLARFEKGTLALGGGLFDMSGVRPVTFEGLKSLDLRGTAFVASDSSFKQMQFGVGLQSPAIRVPGLRGREIANWIVLGVNAQRRDSTDTSSDTTFAAATYRVFVGKSFDWRPPADGTTAEQITKKYLGDAPTMSAALAKRDAIIARGISEADQRFLDAVELAEERIKKTPKANADEIWVSIAQLSGTAQIKARARPTFAIYGELSGWYEFRGGDSSSRSKSLFTLSADYWFMPGRDDVFLRVRYENGHERGAPDTRKNQLLTSIALRF